MGNLLLFSAREMRDDLQGRARSDWSEDGVTLEFVGDVYKRSSVQKFVLVMRILSLP